MDLLDATGPDLVLEIPNGKIIKKNYVGKDLAKYDSLLVLSHFKGHPMLSLIHISNARLAMRSKPIKTEIRLLIWTLSAQRTILPNELI